GNKIEMKTMITDAVCGARPTKRFAMYATASASWMSNCNAWKATSRRGATTSTVNAAIWKTRTDNDEQWSDIRSMHRHHRLGRGPSPALPAHAGAPAARGPRPAKPAGRAGTSRADARTHRDRPRLRPETRVRKAVGSHHDGVLRHPRHLHGGPMKLEGSCHCGRVHFRCEAYAPVPYLRCY